jgi:hypothetical protein
MTMDTTTNTAENSLPPDIKLLRLKQKMIGDYIRHDMELNYLLENKEDETAQRLIDKYYSRICADFFEEYGFN